MLKIKFLKSKFVLTLPLIFVSFQTFLAGAFGYFCTKILSGKETGKPGKIKSIIIKIRQWKIHLHHWLIALAFLLINFYFNFLPFPQFFLGFLSGVICQGLTYSDWYKIFKKAHE